MCVQLTLVQGVSDVVFPPPVINQIDVNFALISVQNMFITLSSLHCVRPFNVGSAEQNTKIIFSGFS